MLFKRRLLFLLVGLAGCQRDGLVGAANDLTVDPAALDFGATYVGGSSSLAVTFSNRSRAPLAFGLQVDAPFSTGTDGLALGGGETRTLEVVFRPAATGPAAATLQVLIDGEPMRGLPVTGEGVAQPECTPSSDCVTARFDPGASACVEDAVADGADCGSERACITKGHCLSGVCRGATPTCDDGNACTRDGCAVGMGCIHDDVASQCPVGAGCQVAVCRPATGCGFETVPDGYRCGDSDCVTSRVCVQGACTERPTPNGASCGGPTVCRAAGACSGTTCVLPPLGGPRVAWTYTAPAPRLVSFSGHVSPDGDVYFREYEPSDSRTAELVSLTRSGAPRFRVVTGWGSLALDPERGRLVAAKSGVVTARATSDGHALWQRDVTLGIPVNDPGANGGSFYVQSLLVAADGTAIVTLLEGLNDHWSYVMALDSATGDKRWQVPLKGHVYTPGISSDGSIWVSYANCWAPAGQVLQLDASGTQRSSRFITGTPAAYAHDEGFVTSGHDIVRTTQGGGSLTLAPSEYPRVAAWRPGRLFALLSTSELLALDYPSLAPLWKKPAGREQLSLAKHGGMLTSEGPALTGLDADGTTTLECRLPASAWGGLPVVTGRLFAQQTDSSIAAFELPGWDTETTGWSSANGGLSRDGRAH